MSAQQIANLLVEKCITAAAEATIKGKISSDEVIVEYYLAVSNETPEDAVQDTIGAYEAQMDAKWLHELA
jgi:hypothetical protein